MVRNLRSGLRQSLKPSVAGGLGDNDIFTTASLDLNFAKYKNLGTIGNVATGQNLVTFTRASSGTYVSSDGLIKTATTNEARFDHDPTTGESLGLLVEEQRTNLLLQSEDFSTTWSAFDASVLINQTTAPDGTTTADKLICGTGTPIFQGIAQTFTATTAATRFSVYVKAGELNQVELRTFNPTELAIFNLSGDGTVVATGDDPDASIVDAGNGWYRCSISAPDTGIASVRISLADGDDRTFTPVTDAGIYIWGAQLEEGSFPTSYIPTEGSAVTRAADVASITGTNFSSWYRQDEGTVFSDSQVINSTSQTQTVYHFDGPSYNASLRQPQGSGDRFRANIGNVFTPAPGTGDNLSTGASKAAVAYTTTTGRLQVGAASDEVTMAGAIDATQLFIGSLDLGTQLNGTIKRFVFWPARLPDETLQGITQQ